MSDSFTIAISHFVKQGCEEAFEAALKRLIQQAKTFAGYEGVQIIKDGGNAESQYLLLVSFDKEANYKRWEGSDIRQTWSAKLSEYVIKESQIRYQEGLEFWFSLENSPPVQPPVKWKMALSTWLVIYPLILILSTLAGSYLSFIPSFLRMLIVSMLLVTSMTYFLMPSITKIFAFWIFKRS
ncbi:MAG: hypothetical protein HRU41_41800 [Saprospiraceae bacterium]|nr:hypothetical protein [Saprospiraceae bacterium]